MVENPKTNAHQILGKMESKKHGSKRENAWRCKTTMTAMHATNQP
jgi:hypothetical protein